MLRSRRLPIPPASRRVPPCAALVAAAAWLGLGTACGAADRPTSVLLVTLDTTRADRIGCYGRSDAGTPALDGLAARGARFDRALATVPITLPSHASLLTGSYPPHHGVRDNVLFVLDGAAETLPEAARRSGYRTAAFVSGVPLAAMFGLDQGFDVYDDDLEGSRPRGEGHMLERTADLTAASAARWLADVAPGDAFFCWVHFFDPHIPLQAPAAFAEGFPGDPYQAEIAFADAHVGELLGLLEKEERLADTLVVVTADHGEGLGEHDEPTHGNLLYDGTMRVPLILAGPGVPRAVVHGAVSVADVAATVVELTAIDDGGAFTRRFGRSLAPFLAGERAPSHDVYLETFYPRIHHGWSELVGIARGDWKYVEAPGARDASDGPRAELFSGGDAAETNDLVGVERALADELAQRLADWRVRLSEGALPAARRELGAGELDDFAALGYGGADVTADANGDTTLPGRDPREVVRAETMLEGVRALAGSGDFEEARSLLDRLVALDPGPVIVHEATGDYHMARARRGEREGFERAEKEYLAATELQPGRRGLFLRRGEALLALDRLAEALASIDRALALAPATPEQLAARAALVRQLEARDE